MNIFTTIAQRPDEIDLERAERDREEAIAAIQEEAEDLQLRTCQVVIRRSLVRIEVSVHLDENGYFDYEDEEDD